MHNMSKKLPITNYQKYQKKLPIPQKMAPFPAVRMTKSAPFVISRVDLFGPFKVKQGGRATHKRWVVLFTCFSTRAVHFEVVEGLSAPVFKNALIRFNSRRPGLRRLYSDNGTNFTRADKDLKKAILEWENSDILDKKLLEGIEWFFWPANSPHWGEFGKEW
jgi:transposase InsO family protein